MKALRSRLHSDEGVALIAALLVLTVISGLALALLLTSNNQQKAGLREQASESAFNVAEASLNAQVGQINRAWPAESTQAYPDEKTNKLLRCTASTSSPNGCPDAAGLAAAYPNISPVPCAAGSTSDKWGSALTNEWTTYVRDDADGTGTLFNSAAEQSQPGWDANGDGKLWVVSVGVVQCRLVKIVTLVARQSIAIPFPKNVVVADWFETTNNGHHSGPIVDTQGDSSQSTNVSLRCSPPPVGKSCAEYQPGQVSPGEVIENASGTSPAIPVSQLESLRKQAEASGTYYKPGTCPTGLPSGELVYVAGPCNITGGANEVANSKAAPGFLIIANGTLSLGGTSIFYGVIYAVNQQKSTGAVVSLGGNAELIGAIDIDGSGGASLGSSGTNIVYSGKAIENLKTYAGAAATRNSFRILPSSE
jgi:Tfp pilus assembly protein PilX